MTERQLLDLVGAIGDVVAVCHKGRQAVVLQRIDRMLELADDIPAPMRTLAIGWVAERRGVSLDQQLPLDLEDVHGRD